VRAVIRLYGKDAMIEVLEKQYASEQDLLLDSGRYNSTHGRTLTQFDRAHFILKAEALGISAEQIASALCITVDRVGELRADRVGKLRTAGQMEIPLKRTIAHMAGKTLTKGQQEANGKLSGMNQMFYANQLIMLIENELLDKANEQLMEKLQKLHELLDDVLAKV